MIIFIDQDNWFKASIEYHTETFSRLGSVVTNFGYSDWATTDIRPAKEIKMTYRLSRRKNDFLIEDSTNGAIYHQMRIFHLHKNVEETGIGVYACSPLNSSITADFSDFFFGECTWKSYESNE